MADNILDDFPYPWEKKLAQQLHITLCQVCPSNKNIVLTAQNAGVDTGMIYTEQAIHLVWAEILYYTAKHGLTRKLVAQVVERLSPSSPAQPFLSDLLQNKFVIPDAEPRGTAGAPFFIKGTDEITEPEALLYRDDLTLASGRMPKLIETMQKMLAVSPSICRLVVDVNGSGQHGTGFRIGKDMLLTNWHVVHRLSDKAIATAVTAEFLYEDDGVGGVIRPEPIQCDVTSIVCNKEDDWAIIRTAEPMKGEEEWPIIKLSESVRPQLNSGAYIIQHPGGNRKRIGFIRNQVSDFDERLVHYLTDTQEGSSGSPVFDENGKLFALHHAGGRPQEVLGKAPVSKNEGINIEQVKLGLQLNGVTFA